MENQLHIQDPGFGRCATTNIKFSEKDSDGDIEIDISTATEDFYAYINIKHVPALIEFLQNQLK